MAAGLELLDAALPGTVGGFTTRAGGVSESRWQGLNLAFHVADDAGHVAANRDLLAGHLGSRRVSFPEQVHGAGVLVVDRARAGSPELRGNGAPGVDALVTAEPGVPIGVLVADCMPVLLADPLAKVIAAAHAGRRGLVAGVLEATLAAMSGLGADPARTIAMIGPAICGRCYEVPEQMRDEVESAVPGTACDTAGGTAGLDLVAGALGVLGRSRVQASASGLCTAQDRRFYSYRRDGVTGRFAGVVMLSADG